MTRLGWARQWRRHRALIGYLGLVAAAIVAMQLYVISVRHDLERHDRISCDARAALSRTQQDLLRGLLKDRRQHRDPHFAGIMRADLKRLNVVLARGC